MYFKYKDRHYYLHRNLSILKKHIVRAVRGGAVNDGTEKPSRCEQNVTDGSFA